MSSSKLFATKSPYVLHYFFISSISVGKEGVGMRGETGGGSVQFYFDRVGSVWKCNFV